MSPSVLTTYSSLMSKGNDHKGPFALSVNVKVNVCIKFCIVSIVMQKHFHLSHHKHNVDVDVSVHENANVMCE